MRDIAFSYWLIAYTFHDNKSFLLLIYSSFSVLSCRAVCLADGTFGSANFYRDAIKLPCGFHSFTSTIISENFLMRSMKDAFSPI